MRKAAPALLADAAGRQPREQHARSRPQADALADRLDHAGALVPEDGRAARLGRAVHRVEVRMADAARVEAHEHLARPRRGQIQLDDSSGAPVRSRTAARQCVLPSAARSVPVRARVAGGVAGRLGVGFGRAPTAAARLAAAGSWPARGGLLQLAEVLDRVVAAPQVVGLDLAQRRLLVHADVADEPRAAGVEDAARTAGRRGWGSRLRAGSAAAPCRRSAAPTTAAPRCTDDAAPAKTVSASPSSITRPRYSTAMRSER